jgi:hypothetical protein
MKAALAALLTAAACAAPVAVVEGPPVPDGPADTCGAAPYAALVGQDATALEKVLIMRQIRIIRPGQGVTMDYQVGRINFLIDETNRISQITCG